MPFQDIDDTARIRRQLGSIGTRTARAGIFSPGKAKQAEKLAYQEFGTDHIPQRQTVAPAFDANVDKYTGMVADGLDRTLAGADGDQIAEDVAGAMEADIREHIKSNTPPPLADSTLAARRRHGNQSTDTLVDTEQMLGAIEHTVIDGEADDG